jgi:hemolysin activation/secretion protein
MKIELFILAVLGAAAGVHAQTPLGGGAQLQQIQPLPIRPKSIPDLRIVQASPSADSETSGARVVLRQLHITGAARFSEAELIAAAEFRPGVEINLAGLRAMAAKIARFYNRRGYFVAQAYVPAQEIQDGAVTIAVVEGRYGKVSLKNHSRVSSKLGQAILAGVGAGDPVVSLPLERRLLLLSDLPGVVAKATLGPGESVGSSDLLVELLPGRGVTGSVEADNAGNRYTGEYRGGGTVNFNEPLGWGDVASLRILTSGSGLAYIRGSYQGQVQDATVGVAYTHLSYRLGREFSALRSRGTVDIASLYASYPVVRSRNTNVYVLADLDQRLLKDRVDTTGSVSERSAQVATLGLAGDHRDRLWGGGLTTWSISGSAGNLRIKTPVVRAIDAVTARTEGGYGKLAFELARLQNLAGPWSLYGRARGQLASGNLDSSEKMELGGAYGIRAYPEGEAYGDEGILLTAEVRRRLEYLSHRIGGDVQSVAFVDTGAVTVNKSPWAPGSNSRNLSAAGVGLTWAAPSDLLVKASYAFELGSERATSAPDRSGRLWVQIVKFF